IGWMGWAKDGEDAGTTGMSCPVEAVQVKLVRKGEAAPGSTQVASLSLPKISFATFSGSDWQSSVGQNAISGTIGQSTPIHGLKAQVDSDISGSIEYRVHLSNIGWNDFVSDNALSGLENSSESIQAVQIRLTGDLAKYFDITYRVYVDNIGWLGWTKNGMSAGTTSYSLNVQAIQIAFCRKGTATTGTAFYSRKADLPYVGFQNPSQYYQVSNRSVSIKNQGYGIFGYRTESRIPYNATRNDCINAMITRAYDYVGSTPYIWDYSCAPGVGVDCAGLVMQSLYATGMNLGRYNPWDHYYTPGHDHYANDMWNDPRFLHLAFSQRQRGDLICYNGHIAIYIGNDQIIEASSPKNGVRVHSVYVGYNIKGVLRPFI
ncbi:NlpC/P60 family protein, partial [Collinsella bouchesdurhonensis]|uniref:NlpC/P60 family protein n=1 Tax=Collinsella bouchesdurhonensis TaxID=1907654 RepID=UPI003F91BBE2